MQQLIKEGVSKHIRIQSCPLANCLILGAEAQNVKF
jgi:hypothetical protein